MNPPLLTRAVHEALLGARDGGADCLECSLDLGRSRCRVELAGRQWIAAGQAYPYLEDCRERTVYHWSDAAFHPLQRFGKGLIKLVPTPWGPPTFEIDGVKMLPSAQVSPYADAASKVALVEPRGKTILDTCGGLGYFAACALDARAARVLTFEINPDVLWLRRHNPWSPDYLPAAAVAAAEPGAGAAPPPLQLTVGDVRAHLPALAAESVDAVLHDPPRFALAGELYAQAFYDELARVLRPGGRLFHYTGAPNRVSRGRDLPGEVLRRLQSAGFSARRVGDGLLARKTG